MVINIRQDNNAIRVHSKIEWQISRWKKTKRVTKQFKTKTDRTYKFKECEKFVHWLDAVRLV